MHSLPPHLALHYARMVADERHRAADRSALARRARAGRTPRSLGPQLQWARRQLLALLTVLAAIVATLLVLVLTTASSWPL